MSPKEIICFKCKHFNEVLSNCAAFEEIPNSIIYGVNDHSQPLRDQKNKIVFEQK
jgi:hypothetical protein